MSGGSANDRHPAKGGSQPKSSIRVFLRSRLRNLTRRGLARRLAARSEELRGGGAAAGVTEERGVSTPDVQKSRARLPIEELAEKRPALLEAPIAYLQVYLSDAHNRERTLQRSPVFYFALNQCSLSYRYICTRLQKRTLKSVMLRENMVNLIALIQKLGRAYPEIAEPVTDQMQKFIAILEDLDRQLAELSNLQVLNWQSILFALKTAVLEHKVFIDPRPFTEFVPSMDDFVQVKLLGKGAFGAVYKATFKGELDVAVKVVPQHKFRNDPKDETPFMDKMVGAVVTNHPYICRVLCAFVASGKDHTASGYDPIQSVPCSIATGAHGFAVTVMEAIDGVDLTELIGRNTALNPTLAQSIMQQCMMAVEHLHLSGFVHRDIKPANMLVMRDGRLKLIDYDVSRVCIGHFSCSYQTSYFNRTAVEFPGGDKAGTEAYMAPEVHQGKSFGRASDWWSIGVVHFRLAFGRLPFRSQQLAAQIVNQEIEWDHVGTLCDPHTSTLKNYLQRLLVKEPRNRLGSKDYAEIFEHSLFAEVNWLKLPEQVGSYDELEAAFAERPSTNVEKDRASVLPAAGSTGKDDLPSLKHLIDNQRDHVPLLTFSSKLIKKMVTGDPGPDAYEDPQRWRHISELKKTGDDTSGGTTMAENKQKKEPVQVIIQEFHAGRRFCSRPRRAVTMRRLLCEDGMYRFLVSEIATEAKVISEAKLYYGDLVLEIDKTSLTNLSDSRVNQLLAKRGAPLVLSVAPDNPFRDAGEATFNLSQLLFRFKPMRLNLRGLLKTRKTQCWRPPQIIHGFTLVVRKVYLSGAAELVCFVDSHEVSLQKVGSVGDKDQKRVNNPRDDKDSQNIFTGDIVLAINNMRLEQLIRGSDPERQVRNLAANLSVDLDFLPCSPIREKNLPPSDIQM